MRTIDGTGNNLNNVTWGASFTHLQRMGDASYSDGISNMFFASRTDPREISNIVVHQDNGRNILNTHGTTDFLWQWGQFIDHDIDLTDGSAAEPENLLIPRGDEFFDPNNTGRVEMSFHRAIYDPDTGTDVNNPREHENEITSWIDASNARAEALRDPNDRALLRTSAGNLLPFNTENLTNANGPVRDATTLFLAGDVRANEQVGLTSLHTLFVREHNRLAELFRTRDPQASAEAVFNSARRLVIAEIQKITFEEHLPALLGPDAIPPYSGYDATLNPSIYSEFSAAAFRLGHSMVSDNLLRLNASGNPTAEGSLRLRDAFFTAPQLLQSEADIDPILRGLATQRHQRIDVHVVNSLRNFLFGNPMAGGLDLAALNIQRGRDHGLPSYNDMREDMGMERVQSFVMITDDVELQQSLTRANGGHVNHIDLWLGGLAETPLTSAGSQLGELFQAILVKQFTELRDGDRFWYERDLSAEELELLADVTLASVIRNNTGIGDELQDDVFRVPQ